MHQIKYHLPFCGLHVYCIYFFEDTVVYTKAFSLMPFISTHLIVYMTSSKEQIIAFKNCIKHYYLIPFQYIFLGSYCKLQHSHFSSLIYGPQTWLIRVFILIPSTLIWLDTFNFSVLSRITQASPEAMCCLFKNGER